VRSKNSRIGSNDVSDYVRLANQEKGFGKVHIRFKGIIANVIGPGEIYGIL